MNPPVECIDVFCHWLPPRFCDASLKMAGGKLHMLARAANMPVMADLDARFAVMDQFPGYRQVPSIASPQIELIADSEGAVDLARRANDEMAEMAGRHRDRFPGFVAALPMNNADAAPLEAQRACGELDASGVQIFTNVNGQPLDGPQFMPLYELMAKLDKPIWLHPTRTASVADYPGEAVSKFELWWALGWPYETSLAMGRLVFAGVFDRWPNLKIITHHVGGMIPMMEGRLGSGLDLLGTRTPPQHADAVRTTLRQRPLDAFRRFYADTASFGSRVAIECGAAFFGIDRLLFASDMPFDPEQGPGYIRETLKCIEEMNLSDGERRSVLSGNARRLLHLN